MKKISVILLNLNRVKETQTCLKKIIEWNDPSIEIIVVEQGDNINVIQMLTEFPQVIVINTHLNIGLEGWNIGCMRATGEILLIIDDDSYPISNNVNNTVRDLFNKNHDVAVIVPKIVNKDGTQWPRFLNDKVQQVVGFTGNAWFIRSDIFKKIGYYPKDYFMFFNEMSIAPKILDIGCRIIYCPEIVFFHLAPPTSRLNAWRIYLFTRNSIWNTFRFDPFYLLPVTFTYLNVEMLIKSIKSGCFWSGYVRGFIHGTKGIYRLRIINNEICYKSIYLKYHLRTIYKSIVNFLFSNV
jgi:GT2 family glycosyltransferase